MPAEARQAGFAVVSAALAPFDGLRLGTVAFGSQNSWVPRRSTAARGLFAERNILPDSILQASDRKRSTTTC